MNHCHNHHHDSHYTLMFQVMNKLKAISNTVFLELYDGACIAGLAIHIGIPDDRVHENMI